MAHQPNPNDPYRGGLSEDQMRHQARLNSLDDELQADALGYKYSLAQRYDVRESPKLFTMLGQLGGGGGRLAGLARGRLDQTLVEGRGALWGQLAWLFFDGVTEPPKEPGPLVVGGVRTAQALLHLVFDIGVQDLAQRATLGRRGQLASSLFDGAQGLLPRRKIEITPSGRVADANTKARPPALGVRALDPRRGFRARHGSLRRKQRRLGQTQ